MKNSAKNTEVVLYVSLCPSTNPRQCMLQARGNTLQQLETFEYLWVAFTCDERRSPRRLVHGLVKLTQFCVSFIGLWLQNGSFQTPQSCQFQIDRCSHPYLCSWILGNDRKNIISAASTKDGIFAESTMWQRAYRGYITPGARNKFGASIFEPEVF